MGFAAEPLDIGRIFQAFTAYQVSGALKGALELDLFSAIAAGDTTAAALAARTGASARGVRMLADFLVTQGMLHKNGDGYALAPIAAAFLDRRSPGYVGSAIQFLASPHLVQAFADVAAAVRRGGTAIPDEGALAPEHPMWVQFARAMAPIARMAAGLMANLLDAAHAPPWKILDVAAGHGLFGIALAGANPRAEVVALDWENVLAVARENADAAGVADRFRTIAGSAFTADYGDGYDLVLLTNFLHHFDPPTCEALLRKVHAALKPGGRAVTLEMMPDQNRVTPPEPAAFSLIMLVTTSGGDAYTFPEVERMCRNAGFAASELHDLPPSFQRVVISRK
jgi:SAM-dependent methyltransferase